MFQSLRMFPNALKLFLHSFSRLSALPIPSGSRLSFRYARMRAQPNDLLGPYRLHLRARYDMMNA